MGNRAENIERAVSALSPFISNLRQSTYYQTDPRDYLDQDYFLNVVVSGSTGLSPLDLLDKTQTIEKSGGRNRDKAIPKGPRTIDLDILLYDDIQLDDDRLIIPHPAITDRRFVLIPMLELNTGLMNPRTGKPYFRELDKIEDQGVYCSSLNPYNKCFVQRGF